MRYIYLISAPPNSGPPPKKLMEAIDKLIAGNPNAMLDGGGFAPQGKGARHRVRGGKLDVFDGPFTESKEVIGGYAIFDFASEADAIESARNFMQLHVDYGDGWEGTCHMYQMFSGPEASPA